MQACMSNDGGVPYIVMSAVSEVEWLLSRWDRQALCERQDFLHENRVTDRFTFPKSIEQFEQRLGSPF
jgi:hypothetical protein